MSIIAKCAYTLCISICCLTLIHINGFSEDSALAKRGQEGLRDAVGQTANLTGTVSMPVAPAPASINRTKAVKPPLKDIGLLVKSDGQEVMLSPNIIKHLGIPIDPEDMKGRQADVLLEGGRAKGFVVHARPNSNHLDIILVETVKGQGTSYYLTSESGELQQAVFAKKGIFKDLSKKEAQKAFQAELAFWQQWETEINRAALADNTPAPKPGE